MLTRALLFLAALVVWGVPHDAAAGDYKLRPGDKLRIEVAQDRDLDRSVLVLPDGTFAFPMAGNINAAGKTPFGVQALLRRQLAPNFVAPPDVYVSVTAIARKAPPRSRVRQSAPPLSEATVKIAVFAMGEVKRPGRIEVAPGTTLLQFLAQAGGLTPFAAKKRVRVHRRDAATGQTRIVKVNVKSLMSRSVSSLGVLVDGDVIFVPERRLFE